MEVLGAAVGHNKRASEARTSDEHARDRAVDAVRDHEREAAKSFANALCAYHGTLAPRWDFHPPHLVPFQLPAVAMNRAVIRMRQKRLLAATAMYQARCVRQARCLH